MGGGRFGREGGAASGGAGRISHEIRCVTLKNGRWLRGLIGSNMLSWLLRYRLLVLIASVAIATGGVFAWTRLPIDAFPDVTNTQVMILSEAPGYAAVDVEQRVTYPIEQAMRGLPRVVQVRSLSKPGLSQVVVVFEDDAETYWTRQLVFERLATVREHLPPGVEPELGPISTGLGEIYQYTLEGEGKTAMELRTIQDWIVAPLLKPIAGVNEVNSFGGEVKQIQVLVSPEKLLAFGLTVQDVVEAVEASNANAGGGIVVRDWEQMYMRGVGLLQDIPDLESTVVDVKDGTPVYLRDVAEVTIGAEVRQGAVTRDGKGEVVAGMIVMLKGENSKEVVSRVKDTVDRIGGTLPEGVKINVFYDRTSLIEACIATVRNALLEGGILVIIVLFLFLAELRTSFIVLVSLPLTFLVSFIVMGWLGISSNLMSLGGLAFSVGMVVDASIVVVENLRRHLATRETGVSVRDTVVAGLREVVRPVGFSVLIVVVILVPLFTLQGIEGKMFAPLAATMLIALAVSLVVALTVVPVLSEMLLTQAKEREFRFVRWIHAGYLRWLDRVLRHPRMTVGISLVVLVGSMGLIPLIGTSFMPPLDEGAIAINVVRLPNASLEGSVQVSEFVEKALLSFPEVETVVSKTGRAEVSEDPMGPEQTDIIVMLRPHRDWTTKRSKQQLVEAMHKELETIPGLRFAFSQPIALRVNELVSGVKSDVAVKLFGSDLDELKELADRVAAVVKGIDGAEDVSVEQVTGMDQLDMVLDRKELARYGLKVGDVNATIETALAGTKATTLIEGERRIDVVVRFAESFRADPERIRRLWVMAPGGERVLLDRMAEFKTVQAPAQVSRENGMRRVVVEANVRGRDLGGFVKETQERLKPVLEGRPSGTWVEYGGQFENQQRAMKQLSIVVPVALGLIVGFLYLALRTMRDALLVLINLPFALVGGVLAVVLFGMPLSVSAAIAFIVLLAIAVQNGVVLMAFIGQLRDGGMALRQAVRKGCDLRFRPLLMTALTSFIGHVPMLYATGSGADIQKPLAVVVNGGIVTSTLLTLVVMPAVVLLVAGRKKDLVSA